MKLDFHSKVNGELRKYSLDFELGESVYDIAKKHAVKLPLSCRNGVCHICRANLLSGEMAVGPRKQRVMTVARVAQKAPVRNELMLCQAWPQSSCEIEVKDVYGPGELAVNKVMCRVLAVEVIKGHVFEVSLQLPAGKLPQFYAGQYLAIDMPEKESPSYFSIASRPGLRELTLHIQADPHLASAVEVVDYLRSCLEKQQTLSLSLPYGKACLAKDLNQPLILIAAGTGFAQMKSILEQLFSQNYQAPVSLYWGVRKEEDMYLRVLAEQWQGEHSNFEFRPLIADIENIDANAHHNQLSDAVLAEHQELENSMVFVSGSPKLVFSAMDALLAAGLSEANFYSDVLEYASRD